MSAPSNAPLCEHCGEPIIEAELQHGADEHAGLCCDCFDLSCGMPLAALNRERLDRGKRPIERPWRPRP